MSGTFLRFDLVAILRKRVGTNKSRANRPRLPEMLVREISGWQECDTDACAGLVGSLDGGSFDSASPPPQGEARGGTVRGLAADQSWRRRTGAVVRLASPWRWSPQTLSLAGFHSSGAGGSSGRRRRPAALEESHSQSLGHSPGGAAAAASPGGKNGKGLFIYYVIADGGGLPDLLQ